MQLHYSFNFIFNQIMIFEFFFEKNKCVFNRLLNWFKLCQTIFVLICANLLYFCIYILYLFYIKCENNWKNEFKIVFWRVSFNLKWIINHQYKTVAEKMKKKRSDQNRFKFVWKQVGEWIYFKLIQPPFIRFLKAIRFLSFLNKKKYRYRKTISEMLKYVTY